MPGHLSWLQPGTRLGSAVQSGSQAAAVAESAARGLDALGLTDSPNHLEVIERRDGLVFLGAGARVGGGQIPFVVRDVYGVDPYADRARIALGEPPAIPPTAADGRAVDAYRYELKDTANAD